MERGSVGAPRPEAVQQSLQPVSRDYVGERAPPRALEPPFRGEWARDDKGARGCVCGVFHEPADESIIACI